MTVKIYSKPSCPNCVQAKSLLEQKGFKYEELILGKDITPDQLFEEFDNLGLDRPRSAPQIFVHQKYVGGYDQLIKYFEETNSGSTEGQL